MNTKPKEKIAGIVLMILSAFGFGAVSVMSATITMTHHQEVISGITIEELRYKGESPKYDCNMIIPQIQGYNTPDVAGINAELLSIAKKFVENTIPEDMENKDTQSVPYTYNVSYQISSGMANVVDITLYIYTYRGGIHGMTDESTYHMDTSTGKELIFDDIFKSGARQYFEDKMSAQIAKDPEAYFPDAKPDITVARFYFTNDEIIFVFPLYFIAPYSSGMPEFRFSKNNIKKWLKKP